MLRRAIPSLLVLLTLVGLCAAADPSHLEMVPDNALLGITIRNVEELEKKGDALVEKTGWQAPDRPSKLFGQLLDFLNIRTGFDPAGSGGVLIANPRDCDVEDPFKNLDVLRLVVAVVPFKDRDDIAANFDLKKGELKAETITRGKTNSYVPVLYARGHQLLLAENDKAIKSVIKAKPCSNLLSAQQKRSLGEADLFIFMGAHGWGKSWEENIVDQFKQMLPNAEHGGDEDLNKQLLESAGAVQHLFAGIRLHDDGVTLKLVTLLDTKKVAAARKLLESLKVGEGTSDLFGLPEGRVVAAEAFRGDGIRNVHLVRALLYMLGSIPAGTANNYLSAADRTTYLGVFAELWKLLKGNRLAVYQTDNEEKKGLFCVVGILDTADPEKMLKEIRQLMRLGDAKELKLGKDGAKDDVALVEKLIGNLGDEDFEVRAAATTKLALIGETTLPFLEKALTSSDAEVRHRAEELKEQIVRSAEHRRKELLDNTLPKPVRPTFTFIPEAQTLEGKRVDVIKIKLADADAAMAKHLQLLFGPDWDKVRLVIHEKRMVVLLGSEEKLLASAVANLKENRPGLAKTIDQVAFSKASGQGRKVELHLSLHTAAALVAAEDLKNPPKNKAQPALTSLGVSLDNDSLQLDAWVPIEELKVVLNAGK